LIRKELFELPHLKVSRKASFQKGTSLCPESKRNLRCFLSLGHDLFVQSCLSTTAHFFHQT
jgi:hypothetical protein